MANGYFERGEIYWIGKVGLATLGVVISSNNDNGKSEYITVAAICGEETHRGVPTDATGRPSFVSCSNIRTVHKREARSRVGSLSSDEMREVDNQLEVFLDLGYEDESKEEELIRLRAEVVQYKSKIDYLNESIIARGKEIANMNAKYNKAVDRIVDLELGLDVAQRISERKAAIEEEPPVIEEPPVVEEQVEETVEEIVEEEPPIEEEQVEEFVRQPVNVNTASAKEISEKLGIAMRIAYGVTGYRKSNGLFVEVDELKEVRTITNPIFERIKDYIVIEEESEVESESEFEETEDLEVQEDSETEKVNVNEANIHELMSVGFSKEVAARIIHSRKMCGPIHSIDELTRTDGVKSKDIRKLRDKLEV